MADMQDGITESIIDRLFKLINTGATSAEQLTEFAEWVCTKSENKEMLKQIKSLVAQGDTNPIRIASALDFSFDDLQKKFKQKNIKCNPIVNGKTGKTYMMYTSLEEDKVRNAVNEIYAEQTRTMEFTPGDFRGMNVGKECTEFKNIDETQLKLIRENAKINNIIFSACINKNGFYDVAVRSDNTLKAYSMIKQVNALTVGETGKTVKAEIQQNIDCIKKVRDMVRDKDKCFYVVSALNPNNYIYITSDEYEHKKDLVKDINGKEQTFSKIIRKELAENNANYVKNISIQAQELSKPIILTPDEFSDNIAKRKKIAREKYNDTLKKNIVKENALSMFSKKEEVYLVSSINANNFVKVEKDNQNLDEALRDMEKPVVLTKEEFQSANKDIIAEKKHQGILDKSPADRHKEFLEMKARQLIEFKMSLNNNEQVENLSSLYNNDVSFNEFFEHELVNSNHSEEEIENIAKLEKDFDCMSSEDQNYIKDYIEEVDAQVIEFEEEKEITKEDAIEYGGVDYIINSVDNNKNEIDMADTQVKEIIEIK